MQADLPLNEEPATPAPRRRERLHEAAASTATRLLPLLALADALQPQLTQESVFRTRRKKLKAHLAEVYAELHAERPRRQALAHAFQALADLVREEAQDISPDEWKQAAKEVALATLKNAPALINTAYQARLLV
ncbi:MAG TPA: hypothetical protein VFO93_05670 [Hymenobacter sp.]|uniref:hypothetical protein n=1 Tax=Hymenobacter sp. TaxID=1898978 RepID=UPI002D7FA86A|nr:hypothetical protein [Hymenobacter sp.]HET9503006.1 hypothetical protein [Hymenobacter sp.]